MKNFIKINRALAAEKKLIVVLSASLVCAVNAFAQASDSKPVDCGKSVTITASPKDGFHFVQWSDGSTEATRTFAVTEVWDLTASFAADETVIDPSIDPGVDFPVAHGEILHLTPHTDDECMEFWHWSDIDENDVTNPDYNIVPRDFEYNGVLPTFTAVFKIKVFDVTVTADDADHGDVTVTIVEP